MGGWTDGRTDKWNLRHIFCNECKYLISLGAFAKLQKNENLLHLICLSVGRPARPLGTTGLPLDRFSLNLIFEYFSKIRGTLHDYLCTYMTMYRLIHLRMRNVSEKYCRENQNIHFIFCNFYFFRKSCRLWDNVKKMLQSRAGHR